MKPYFKFAPTLVLTITAGFFSTVGQAEGDREENFSQAKTMTLKMLEQRIEDLKGTRSCVQKAKNRADMKDCKLEAREERREMRSEIKETREKIKQERKELNDERMQRKE